MKNSLLVLAILTLIGFSFTAKADDDDDSEILKKTYNVRLATCVNQKGRLYQVGEGYIVPKGALKVEYFAKSLPVREVLLVLNDEVGGVTVAKALSHGFEYKVQYHDNTMATVQIQKNKTAKIIIDPDVSVSAGGYLYFDCDVRI